MTSEEAQFLDTQRVRAHFRAKSLVSNYKYLQLQLQGQAILPMVKANAYGHGVVAVVRALRGQKDCFGFGVATLAEGAVVREALAGSRAQRQPIIVFSESSPWSEEKGAFCLRHGLTPVISSTPDWLGFCKRGWSKKLSYHLEFNTGLNRFGIDWAEAHEVVRDLRLQPPPQGVFSHLAMADHPQSALSRAQVVRFRAVRQQFLGAEVATRFHLGNSAAIWNHEAFALGELTTLVRPGLALYGIPPWRGAAPRGLEPVLTLEAPIVQMQRVLPGESVGYGGTYQVLGVRAARIGIVGAGYGDGIHRALGNRGFVVPQPSPSLGVGLGRRAARVKPLPMVGRVSMDLLAILCGARQKVGDWVQLLGPQVDAWELAQAADTIPYELFTALAPRVRRVYSE